MENNDYTSKNTSVNKLAAFYKKAVKHGYIIKNDYILDYGCGKNLCYTVSFAINNGFRVIGYDPYHLKESCNSNAINHKIMRNVTAIVCNNVLNVLTTADMIKVLLHLQELAIDYNIPIMFTVYEGDRTGNGRATKKDCYQRNEKLQEYVNTIGLYFGCVTIKHGIISARM